MILRGERSSFGDGLCSAPYPQFATNIIHMLLDRVHTEDQFMDDLTVGCAIQEQLENLVFALREWLFEYMRTQCLEAGTG